MKHLNEKNDEKQLSGKKCGPQLRCDDRSEKCCSNPSAGRFACCPNSWFCDGGVCLRPRPALTEATEEDVHDGGSGHTFYPCPEKFTSCVSPGSLPSGCCPYVNGECCGDGTCCPAGFTCDHFNKICTFVVVKKSMPLTG